MSTEDIEQLKHDVEKLKLEYIELSRKALNASSIMNKLDLKIDQIASNSPGELTLGYWYLGSSEHNSVVVDTASNKPGVALNAIGVQRGFTSAYDSSTHTRDITCLTEGLYEFHWQTSIIGQNNVSTKANLFGITVNGEQITTDISNMGTFVNTNCSTIYGDFCYCFTKQGFIPLNANDVVRFIFVDGFGSNEAYVQFANTLDVSLMLRRVGDKSLAYVVN